MDERSLPPEHRDTGNSILIGPDGLRAGWGVLLFIILFTTMISLANGVMHRLHFGQTHHAHEMSARSALLTEGMSALIVIVATWLMAKIERRRVGVYGLGGERKLPQFAAGLGWGIVFLSCLVGLLKTFGLLVFDRRLLFGGSILRHGAIWLGGFLLVALLEEMLLRGYLQFTLARGLSSLYEAINAPHAETWGFWTAAFLLSLVFGLGHGSNPGESPIGLLSAGVAGLVFCLSLWRTGSLWWAIGFHTSWDWAQSFLYGVGDSGTMVQFRLFATRPVGAPVLSGGATGPEGSVLILPVMAVVAGIILWTLPARVRS